MKQKIMLPAKADYLHGVAPDDLREVKAMIANGDKKAELVYNTMIYSMGKWTAMMAGALKGKVDAILLTGGMARDTELCVNWLNIFPGSHQFITMQEASRQKHLDLAQSVS